MRNLLSSSKRKNNNFRKFFRSRVGCRLLIPGLVFVRQDREETLGGAIAEVLQGRLALCGLEDRGIEECVCIGC